MIAFEVFLNRKKVACAAVGSAEYSRLGQRGCAAVPVGQAGDAGGIKISASALADTDPLMAT
jgi:hypothetical protein